MVSPAAARDSAWATTSAGAFAIRWRTVEFKAETDSAMDPNFFAMHLKRNAAWISATSAGSKPA